MSGDEFTRLESDRVPGKCTYHSAAYDGGRFAVKSLLAAAGQGYVLLVEDTWSGAPAVLKGMWWKQSELHDARNAGSYLNLRNAELLQGLAATMQATQLTQQAPVVVDTLREPSPALLATGVHTPPDEIFIVQQFVGYGWSAARTLKDDLATRAAASRRFTSAELLDLADQLCSTLAALHTPRRRPDGGRTAYWVHADVKPENILVLGPPWQYVLIDYDGAVEKDDVIRVTTDNYAPPLPLGTRERDSADQRFDIYMLGATLAEAAGLRQLDDNLRLNLYRDESAHQEAKRQVAELGYGPILTSVIATCLAEPNYRIAEVGIVQDELTRARQTSALARALLEG
jgi:serine/threonine protein kinase